MLGLIVEFVVTYLLWQNKPKPVFVILVTITVFFLAFAALVRGTTV